MISEAIVYNFKSKKFDSWIIVELGEESIINYIQILLMNEDNRSYSYYVDVSLDGVEYTRLIVHTTVIIAVDRGKICIFTRNPFDTLNWNVPKWKKNKNNKW